MSTRTHTPVLPKELLQVRQHWDSDGRLAPATRLKYERVHEDWLRQAPASLDAATAVHVQAFAVSRTRMGARPAPATQAARMAALDTTFITAHRLGLTTNDPTARLRRPERSSQPRATVSDTDRAHLHVLCRKAGLTRQGSVVACLAECGASTAEIGKLTLDSLSDAIAPTEVHLPGTARRPARTVGLTAFAQEVFAARADQLRSDGNRGDHRLLGRDMSQESVCMALRGLVKGHAAVEHVTATGLNGWGARHVFRRTGDLRAAAALLGMKDLTAVARVVGALGPFGP